MENKAIIENGEKYNNNNVIKMLNESQKAIEATYGKNKQ
jgi:hypothetical protein